MTIITARGSEGSIVYNVVANANIIHIERSNEMPLDRQVLRNTTFDHKQACIK